MASAVRHKISVTKPHNNLLSPVRDEITSNSKIRDDSCFDPIFFNNIWPNDHFESLMEMPTLLNYTKLNYLWRIYGKLVNEQISSGCSKYFLRILHKKNMTKNIQYQECIMFSSGWRSRRKQGVQLIFAKIKRGWKILKKLPRHSRAL